MLAADGAITNETHSNRGSSRPARGDEDKTADQLLEGRAPVVMEAEVNESPPHRIDAHTRRPAPCSASSCARGSTPRAEVPRTYRAGPGPSTQAQGAASPGDLNRAGR